MTCDPDRLSEDDLIGTCDYCGEEADTSVFSGWNGDRELCDECAATAAMEE